jgi:hypothetical protein
VGGGGRWRGRREGGGRGWGVVRCAARRGGRLARRARGPQRPPLPRPGQWGWGRRGAARRGCARAPPPLRSAPRDKGFAPQPPRAPPAPGDRPARPRRRTELIATAISASVTVSMGELTMGMLRSMLRVTLVARLTWRWEAAAGRARGRGSAGAGPRRAGAALGGTRAGGRGWGGAGRARADVAPQNGGCGRQGHVTGRARARGGRQAHLMGAEVDVAGVEDDVVVREAVALAEELGRGEACGRRVAGSGACGGLGSAGAARRAAGAGARACGPAGRPAPPRREPPSPSCSMMPFMGMAAAGARAPGDGLRGAWRGRRVGGINGRASRICGAGNGARRLGPCR